MALHFVIEARQRLGEIGLQRLEEERIVRGGTLHDLRRQLELAVGQQHGQLGPGQALALGLQLRDGDGAGQPLDPAVQASGRHEVGHEAGVGLQLGDRVGFEQAEGEGLIVIVDQDVIGHRVGHRFQ